MENFTEYKINISLLTIFKNCYKEDLSNIIKKFKILKNFSNGEFLYNKIKYKILEINTNINNLIKKFNEDTNNEFKEIFENRNNSCNIEECDKCIVLPCNVSQQLYESYNNSTYEIGLIRNFLLKLYDEYRDLTRIIDKNNIKFI